MKKYDLSLISRIIIILIISFIVYYAFNGISKFDESTRNGQTDKIEKIIDKALVQCYALEGGYPNGEQFKEKMEKYGVIINEEEYIYHYEIIGSNIKPYVKVIKKNN